MPRTISRFIASILLVTFSVYLIPNEFVHALYGHKDTCETSDDHHSNSVGVHHIHCDFLSYEASLFTSPSSANFPISYKHDFAFASFEMEQAGITFSNFPSLRGPPFAV